MKKNKQRIQKRSLKRDYGTLSLEKDGRDIVLNLEEDVLQCVPLFTIIDFYNEDEILWTMDEMLGEKKIMEYFSAKNRVDPNTLCGKHKKEYREKTRAH